jgi:hypothetical protein
VAKIANIAMAISAILTTFATMVKMVRNGKIVYVRILFASIQC